MINYKNQEPSQTVDISDWLTDEAYNGTYPKGARAKITCFCPHDSPYNFLIANPDSKYRHRYIFKLSFNRYPAQFWAEIVAYRIGCLMQVSVPPSFAAINKKENQYGALIEWFYHDYPPGDKEHYIDGGVFMKQLIPNFDSKKGKQHNFETIMKLKTISTCNWLEEWGKIFIFDAVIGNTDRHQDNWGVIGKPREKTLDVALSPAFDNGTSLGHEMFECNFNRFDDKNYLDRYVQKGTYHMKWKLADNDKTTIMKFIRLFADNYPEQKADMLNCLNFSIEEATEQIMQLTKFQIPEALSEARAKFMIRLIAYRQKLLNALLEK
ncbi:MAG: hypothetical protein FD145_987 [Candidatus Saganbacteria bacterium]|uniref:HipA-like C-terminal domain-containing protein n=1 Tax=Candidatus Saganbacteria bacterium TaxID=2575572 RepID=A0A833NWW4_UNCSA|nr:MAG: hypothetical protein FD145_987 [Candidatus Saganbacteria bacterium]